MQKLQKFKEKVDKEIESYFDRVIKEAKGNDRSIEEALKYVKKMTMAGGKRLRPALMYYGYLAANGRDKKRIIKTSASIELIHIFLLIHDDIIDKGDKRHGIDTVHIKFESIGRKLFSHKDPKHFGNSMAIIIGDMIGALGNQIIFESGFDSKLIMKALDKLQSIISLTVVGEAKDIYIEHKGKASEKEVMKMYEYKTAKYTFEGPLHLGAILGGAGDKLLEQLSQYAIPIGIAFQIQDDILGIFGSEKKLGKSVASDIEEGKFTILVAKAKERADQKQNNILKNILGKKNLSPDEIKDFQKVIRDTGALDYAREVAGKLIAQSKKAIIDCEIKNSEAKKFFLDVADYMIQREV